MISHAEARERLLQQLTATLAALPPGAALACRHPDLPDATLSGSRVVLLANDMFEEVDEHGPSELSVSYWVLGIAPDDSTRYLDLLAAAWHAHGWRVDPRPEFPRSAHAKTPDGYGLHVIQSVNGYLSLHAGTPPFLPRAHPPLPDRLDRPVPGSAESGPFTAAG